jgi:hypothetical protein
MAFDHLSKRRSSGAKPYHIRRFTFELRDQVPLIIYAALLLGN